MIAELLYAALLLVIAILLIFLIEIGLEYYGPTPDDNAHEQARRDRIDAANLAAFYPPTGRKGFAAQNERRQGATGAAVAYQERKARAHVHPIRSRKVN